MGALLLFAAWVSGAAALVAETVWFRALGRGVGTSAEALAVVSAAFLGGLGIGAAIAARRAPRSASPLRTAALCEGAAALLVFLSPWAVALVPDAHLALLRTLDLAPGPSAWPAALVAVPVLLLPAAFLGATLPFLVRGRVRRLGHAGRWTGWLYGLNTLGAACGVALASVWLLPGLGETASLRLAAAGNALAALLLLAAERPDRSPSSSAASSLPMATTHEALRLPRWAPAGALFASGAFALGGEVAWFRLLEPVTGVHLYGFAVLLVAVLVGTAAGAALGGRAADRMRRPDLGLAVALAGGGLLTLLSVVVAGSVPWLAAVQGTRAVADAAGAAEAAMHDVSRAGRDAVFLARLAGAVATVLPPLMAFAAAYPLAVRARARSAAEAAGAVGSVYAWNTLGNVVGSLAAGFLLLPRLGGPLSLALLGGGGLLVAAAVWLAAPRPRPAIVALVIAAPVGLLGVPGVASAVEGLGPRLPEVVAMGKWYRTFQVGRRDDFRFLAEVIGGTYPVPPGSLDGVPVRPREGVTSTVGLLEERGTVRLRQGGLSESKFDPTDPDAGSETEVALGLLPYLAHAAPRTALVVGHGAGWTVETLLACRLERVDVAEIEPAVLDVVEAWRGPLAVRDAPNARIQLADGRLLLRDAAAEGGRYDLVVSQPSHPWVPGAGHLFTSDAYRLARSALREGGVFAQWLNVFNMDADLLRTALASFAAVFDDAWGFVYPDEIVLLGFAGTGEIDAARWQAAFDREPVGDRARAAGIRSPADLLRRVAFDGRGLRELARGAAPSTDDEPRLETGLAWSIFTGATRPGAEKEGLLRHLRSTFPPDVAAMIPDAAGRERLLAATAFRAVAAGGEDARRWAREVPFDGGVVGRRARARERLSSARAAGLSDEERARLREDAVGFLREALRLQPDDGDAARELLDALQQAGRGGDAVAAGEELVARRPDDGPLLAEWARALVGAGDEPRAIVAFERATGARTPPAPPGTGLKLARLHLAATPTRKAQARDALRADATVKQDLEALETLLRLEIETSTDPTSDTEDVVAARRVLAAAERDAGAAALARARRLLTDEDVAGGLASAREATVLRPDDPLAWRWRGWFELRDRSFDAAATSLARAVDLAEDRDTEWRRARAFLRLFGRDPGTLDEAMSAEATR